MIELDNQEATLYNDRRMVGQIADQKAKYAKEQPHYPEARKLFYKAIKQLLATFLSVWVNYLQA